jgi:hypothetical protein
MTIFDDCIACAISYMVLYKKQPCHKYVAVFYEKSHKKLQKVLA